jgi:hypothetical protein
VEQLGFKQAIVCLVVCTSMALSPAVYAVVRGVKSVVGMYRGRIEEAHEWLADEEVDGLLQGDRYFGDSRESKEEEVAKEKGGEKTSVEEPLQSGQVRQIKGFQSLVSSY